MRHSKPESVKNSQYEIVLHGRYVSQKFPGSSAAGSQYDVSVVGLGSTAEKAVGDAMEVATRRYDLDVDVVDSILEAKHDEIEGERNSEVPFYASIRLNLEGATQ